MTDPYLDAITNLAGHSNFQKFEGFAMLLARRYWRNSRVEKSSDKKAMFDIIVFDYDEPSRVFAQIECKASREDKIINLINSWKPKSLRNRIQNLKDRGQTSAISYIFTTAPVEKEDWDKNKGTYGLDDCELWDANRLATIVREDPNLATYLSDYLPTSDPIFKQYSLDLIVQEKRWPPWIPLKQIIEEPLNEPLLDLTQPVLIYGPPNVGKTCWAIRQAWYWLHHHERKRYDIAFFLDITRLKNEVELNLPIRLVKNLPVEANVLFVIDDIHFAQDEVRNWVQYLEDVVETHKSRVNIIWISRDISIAEKLGIKLISKPIIYPFPIEEVLNLFTKQLKQFVSWQRIIAAFETRLDPHIAYELRNMYSSGSGQIQNETPDTFVNWLEKETSQYLRKRLTKIEEILGETGYDLYLKLLPLGSLNHHIEESFLKEIGVVSTPTIEKLIKNGLVTYVTYNYPMSGMTGFNNNIYLVEHPFQIRQTLKALETLPEIARGRIWTEQLFPDWPKSLTISEAIFGLYLSRKMSYQKLSNLINELGNYAEWAGVKEPYAKALKFLLERKDCINDIKTRNSAVRWYHKLTRSSYPENEKLFITSLEDTKKWWEEEQRKVVEIVSNCKSGNYRLDHILYEIAYIDFLLCRYDLAKEIFSKSVDAGLEIIKKGMNPEANTEDRKNGALALANIWIAGLLERSSSLRALFLDGLNNKKSKELPDKAIQLINEIALIHERLAIANKTAREKSADLYFMAVQAIRPEWKPPATGILFERTKEMEEFLGRHELNAWMHSLETSCWPVLFGFSKKRIPTNVPSPYSSYQASLLPPAHAVGLPAYRKKQIELLYRWAEDPETNNLEEQVISTAALLHAGGGYEYLGDLLLLAWHCTNSNETANILAWYLENKIPTIGFNDLPKLALGTLK